MNRRIREAKLFLLLALVLMPAAQAQSPAPAPSRVVAVPFESRLVGRALPYNVVLPADYAQTAREKTRYPVLYLLHGLGGGAGDWVSARSRLAEYAAQHRLII